MQPQGEMQTWQIEGIILEHWDLKAFSLPLRIKHTLTHLPPRHTLTFSCYVLRLLFKQNQNDLKLCHMHVRWQLCEDNITIYSKFWDSS